MTDTSPAGAARPGPARGAGGTRGPGAEGRGSRAAGRGPSAAGRDAGPGAAGAPPPPPHRLVRSRRHKVVGGVCAGLGQYFGMDPVIFRIVLGVLTAAGGLGLVAYGFAWLLMPLAGEEENEGRRLLSGRVEGQALTALLFAVVGCGLFLSMLGSTKTHIFAALLILCLGGAAYWSHHRREAEELLAGGVPVDEATAHAVADAPPETAPPPVPYTPSWWRDPLTKDGGGAPGYLWGPDDGPYDEVEASVTRARPVHEPAGIGGWIFVAAAGVCGTVTATTWRTEPLGTTLAYGLAGALAVFGLGFVLSAWYGRTGGGTAFWALVASVLLAGALWLPESITTEFGQESWHPAAAAQVRDRYELGSGEARLDLTDIGLKKGQRLRTSAEVGLGQLDVTVPDDVRTVLRTRVDVGATMLPREPGLPDPGDIDVNAGQRASLTMEPAGGGAPKGTLVLDLRVSIGQLEVQRAAP